MIGLNILLDGDNCWPDLREKGFVEGRMVAVARLRGGTQEGNSTVSVRVELPDGRTVVAETTMKLFHAAATAFATRDGMEAAERKAAADLAIQAAKAPPVDRSQQTLTNGEPVTPDHREIEPETGMQKAYVVLSPEERAKGFVRPYRDSYIHVGVGGHEVDPSNPAKAGLKGGGCGAQTRMGRAIAETYARDPGFYNGTYCVGCKGHFPLEEFVWADTDQRVGS